MSFGMTSITNNYILGISYGYHDSAVALLQNGFVLSAVEEERFTGIKHEDRFPIHSINWTLKKHGLSRDDIHAICYYEHPKLKTDRSPKRNGSTKIIKLLFLDNFSKTI